MEKLKIYADNGTSWEINLKKAKEMVKLKHSKMEF